ncbi:20088_t:CDS:2 [Dentiscutata erythropus]|uniref:20088_t:CDS:1 n=1 Tax=Dentiscutata erythropus TaxID=1348616 RepID=A0A9N9CLS9_9GLOM|nr:20088_t:CDS:2 [Dentiscutata erythropus]
MAHFFKVKPFSNQGILTRSSILKVRNTSNSVNQNGLNEWQFLFEDASNEDDNKKVRKKTQTEYQKLKRSRPDGYFKAKEEFRQIYSALFDRHRPTKETTNSSDSIPLLQKHLNELKTQSKTEQIIKYPQSKQQSDATKWFHEQFGEAITMKIQNNLIECKTTLQLRDYISNRIFPDSTITKVNNESPLKKSTNRKNRVIDDLGRPIDANYATLLKESIALCRTKFNDPYMAFAIFEQVKRRGVISYVLGCNAQVYNELIKTRWDCWRDLYGVGELLNEMLVNGIDFDEGTREVVSDIALKVFDEDGKLTAGWELEQDGQVYKNITEAFKVFSRKLKRNSNSYRRKDN